MLTTSAKACLALGLVMALPTAGAIQARAQTSTFTLLHSFNGTDGASLRAGLIQARDGKLYGTTFYGGANDGTIFKITPSGDFTLLYTFSASGSTDGGNPDSLIQASDGNLYGTTL